jgi:hypothetical protein
MYFDTEQQRKSFHKQEVRRMPSSMMLHCVALVRTDVSEERSTSIIRVTRSASWEC